MYFTEKWQERKYHRKLSVSWFWFCPFPPPSHLGDSLCTQACLSICQFSKSHFHHSPSEHTWNQWFLKLCVYHNHLRILLNTDCQPLPSPRPVSDSVGLIGTRWFAVLTIFQVMFTKLVRDHTENGFQVTVCLTSLNTANIWDSDPMMISQAPECLSNYKLVHLTTTSGDSHQEKLFGYGFIRLESSIFLCKWHLSGFLFLFCHWCFLSFQIVTRIHICSCISYYFESFSFKY